MLSAIKNGMGNQAYEPEEGSMKMGDDNSMTINCPQCLGEGKVWADNGDGTGTPNAPCGGCDGTGIQLPD